MSEKKSRFDVYFDAGENARFDAGEVIERLLDSVETAERFAPNTRYYSTQAKWVDRFIVFADEMLDDFIDQEMYEPDTVPVLDFIEQWCRMRRRELLR